jgi:hypothetical protein
VNPVTPREKEREKLERRVEGLAGEIAALINTSSGEERNDLRDLALSIVREEVRTGEEDRGARETERRTAGPFNPIAMAIPMFLIGAVMIVLFPPMGLFLFGVSFLLVGWGVAVSLFARR